MRKSDVLLFSPLKGYEYYLSECTKEVLMAIGGVFEIGRAPGRERGCQTV